MQRHDVSLDRLLTLVGCGLGVLLALEGATGASYPGLTFREIHDGGAPAQVASMLDCDHVGSADSATDSPPGTRVV